MECRVCRCEIEQGLAKCPACGFPVMVMVNGSAQEEEKIAQLADSYRKKKLSQASVALRVYTNALDADGTVRVTRTEDIVLAQGEGLAGNEILWYPEKFARLSGDPSLAIFLVSIGGEQKSRMVRVKNPGIEGFWQIGVKPDGGFRIRLVLGSEEKYAETESISLL